MATPGTIGRPRPRRSRFRFFLFVFLVIFGLGFYSGMRVTRHVARSSPAWLQKFFGVEGNWLGLPVPPPADKPVPAPTVTPITPAAAAPAATPAAPPTNSALPSTNPVPPANAPTPGTSAALSQQVTDYNASLLRAANAFRDYTVALHSANDTKAEPQAREAAQDHVNTAADELQSSVHRAQNLYDTIHADPSFAAKYKETDKALDSGAIRQQFAELSVDNLRYIRPR